MLKLPDSLTSFLFLFRPCFTAPTFETFTRLCIGQITCIGERTVTGLLQAANMVGFWHHSRAHDFFSRTRWSPDEVGFRLLDFLVGHLTCESSPLSLVVDDTLFPRSGKKVADRFLHHDGGAPQGAGRHIRWGNNWVVVGLLVKLPFMNSRTVCLPVLFRVWRPRDEEHPERLSKPELARQLVNLVIQRYAERQIELVGDCAYASGAFADLPEQVTATFRLRVNAALSEIPPVRQEGTKQPVGRPRKRGGRLPTLTQIATDDNTIWEDSVVERAGREVPVETHTLYCLWYAVFGEQSVRVTLARDKNNQKEFIALVSTDTEATSNEILTRYQQRWAVETCFQDAKGQSGVGQARNRTALSVARTVPFGFLCQTLTIAWYLLNGCAEQDVKRRRREAPWYQQKKTPSYFDMLVALRREIIKQQLNQQGGQTPLTQKTIGSAQVLEGVVA